MPFYDEAVPNGVLLEEAIEQLAEQYGPSEFNQALERLEWITAASNMLSPMQQDQVKLLDAITHYYSSDTFQGLAESSQLVYKYEINLFLKYCTHIKGENPDIKEVSSAIFLKDYLAPVNKLNTRSKKSAFLRSFLGEVFEHFFKSKIDKLKRTLSIEVDKNKEPRAFSKQQLDELLRLVRLGREAYRNFTIIWSFLGSGIRLSELCTLQVGDVFPDRQEILVRGKGKKGYKQANKMTKSSLDALCSYIKFRYKGLENESDYLNWYIFSDNKGQSPLHESTIQKMFSAIIDEAQTIPELDKKPYHFSVHSLRHSFALYLLESGVNIYTIKELMRHAWLSSTEVYLKLYDSMLVDAIDKHPLAQIKVSDFF
ncbi:MAG: tyrosine-type recombinase/integrase [Paenibacillaceae bacterium]